MRRQGRSVFLSLQRSFRELVNPDILKGAQVGQTNASHAPRHAPGRSFQDPHFFVLPRISEGLISSKNLRPIFANSIACRSISFSTLPLALETNAIPEGGFLPLNLLRDKDGSRRRSKRVGRGMGSGKGKTAGRGHKGQKARSGRNPKIGFEGGQTPLNLRLPKRGFHNPFSMEFQVVNLGDVVHRIQEGAIDPDKLITMKALKDARLGGKSKRDGVKLLARGSHTLDRPLHFEVSRVSSSAKEAVELAGGSVTRVHYNKLGLRALLDPEWFTKKGRELPKAARTPPRLLKRVDCVGRLPAPTEPEAQVQSEIREKEGGTLPA